MPKPPLTPVQKLKSLADGIPRQESLFDANDQPPENWAWVVLFRIVSYGPSYDQPAGEWSDWSPDWDRPNHFRSREGAERKIAKRALELEREIKLGIIELKIEPKYIGYVPGKDEAWIAD